jgi:hypothetical protein
MFDAPGMARSGALPGGGASLPEAAAGSGIAPGCAGVLAKAVKPAACERSAAMGAAAAGIGRAAA